MKTNNASALIFATILLFVVLSLVVSMSYVTVLEQRMSSKTKSSVGAFYNSDSGIEWALNKISYTTNPTIGGTFGSLLLDKSVPVPSGANYKVYLLDKDGKVITDSSLDISTVKAVRSVGTQTAGDPTQRAIEAAVASSDSVYDTSCAYYGYYTSYTLKCCRIKISDGTTTCTTNVNNWPSAPNLWTTPVAGKYSISCSGQMSSTQPTPGLDPPHIFTCCRTETINGNVDCQ